MKRSAIKRGKPLARGKPLKRGAQLRARKIPKAFAKRRDPRYVAWIRTQPCLLWHANAEPYWRAAGVTERLLHACVGSIQACHVKSRGSGGDDTANLWPGCAGAHDEQHRIGIWSFQARWGIDLKAEAARLFQAYQRETGTP